MYYIKENDKPGKIYQFFIKLFNIIELNDNLIEVAKIQNLKGKKKERILKKVAKKTIYLLDKTNSKKIVLSKNLKQEDEYKNYLYSKNYDIVDGKYLFTLLASDVLEYIIKKRNIEKKELKIAILANDISNLKGIIYDIVRKYKNVTIISRHISKLKIIQNELYEKEGIVIAISNNKRKSLLRTNIILNFDFPEETINKFSIYEDANIINFNNKIRIHKKRFNGTNIYDYEIKLKKDKLDEIVNFNKELIKSTYTKDIYEAQLYKQQNFTNLRNKIRDDGVKIKYLLGNNIF